MPWTTESPRPLPQARSFGREKRVDRLSAGGFIHADSRIGYLDAHIISREQRGVGRRGTPGRLGADRES